MNTRQRLKTITTIALLAAVLNLSACGYVLYPERKGQSGGKLDAAVFLLDAAGLLFGIIPGVIAFAVDISTGTIYLPAGDQSVIDKHLKQGGITPVRDPGMNKELLADKLSMELGRPITAEMIRLYEASPHGGIALASMEVRVLK
ncbi:hypothetical protein [Desulfoluna spongiiphila]|uniref:Uncharacterized protein n=1 Tax=Desulfoluna spongiiphila TaxID=419481 RepID=A0A1G5JJ10_9BACT|nr:hypothetical protein [Desulfoluna spongiiphila]SCY87871.1 hypothetical protein SAMN05216233_13125 [Desulfoluna spongiiphila]VVS94904.1 hypothetical protein DBB_44810 [Desulfoluna spongiiphila]